MDNAPRFASRDERRLADTRRLAAPDFSTYAILQCEALARMAQRLEREDEAATFRARAGAIRDAMNERLWHEEDGLYYDRDERSGEWVRCAGITSLLPLAAGVPEGRRAERLRLRCEDPAAFATPLPFPSVARADAAFEKDMWRGPVWINTAYLALRGLDRYGWDRVWARLAWRLCAGVYRVYAAEGHFFEFYDPDAPRVDALRRKRGNAWKAFVLGRAPQKEFVGWSGLVNPLLLEMVFGTEEEEDGPLLLRPRFSPEAAGRRWRIELPQRRVTLALTVTEEGGVEGAAVAAGRAHPVAAGFAETVRVGAC
jgi:glycogen debranching enzyme